MEFRETLFARRSIRKYKPDPVSDEQIRFLMEAAMCGPSGMNLRPYRFIVIRDKATLDRAKSYCPYGKYNSPAVIFVIGDAKRSPHMWGNDCGAATENILLAATDLGLGTVWCAMYPFADRNEPVKKLLGIGEGEEIYSMIHVGYPDEERPSRGIYEESKVQIIG